MESLTATSALEQGQVKYAAYAGARVVPAVIGFVSTVVFTHFLGVADYGRYALFVGAGSLMAVVAFGWLQHGVLRELIGHDAAGSTGPFLASVTALLGCTALLIMCFATFTAVGAAWMFGMDLYPPLLLATAGLAVVKGLHSVVLKVFHARQEAGRFALVTILFSVGTFLGAVVVGASVGPTATTVLSGSVLAGGLVTGAFALVALGRARPVLSAAIAGEMMKYGIPLAFAGAATWGLSTADRYVIALFHGEAAVAPYAAIYNVASQSVSLVLRALMLTAFPAVIAVWERTGRAQAQHEAAGFTATFWLIGCGLVGILCAIRRPLVDMILPSAYYTAADLLPWIMGAILLGGLMEYSAFPFQLYRQTGTLSKAMAVAFVVNLVLNLLFVPGYGASAAAVSTLVSYTVLLIMVAGSAKVIWGWSVFDASLLVPVALAMIAAVIGDLTVDGLASAAAVVRVGAGCTVAGLSYWGLTRVMPMSRRTH